MATTTVAHDIHYRAVHLYQQNEKHGIQPLPHFVYKRSQDSYRLCWQKKSNVVANLSHWTDASFMESKQLLSSSTQKAKRFLIRSTQLGMTKQLWVRMQMQQYCLYYHCHPFSITKIMHPIWYPPPSSSYTSEKEEDERDDDDDPSRCCCVCYDDFSEDFEKKKKAPLDCHHPLCIECRDLLVVKNPRETCPLCRSVLLLS